MAKIIELRLRGVEGVDVAHPQQSYEHGLAIARVGKTYDAESETFVPSSDAELIRLDEETFGGCKHRLAVACKNSELACADQATADLLGVPFAAPAAPVRATRSSTPAADAAKGDA